MTVQEFLAHNVQRFPGEIMFAKLWGSRSHNTQLETSDWDWTGVYVAPTKRILSMFPPPTSVTNDEGHPHFQFHEVGHFASLLLKGNPGIVEMLFTERDQHWPVGPLGGAWYCLREWRGALINQRTLGAYLGYAQGQMQRLGLGKPLHSKGGGYSEKWAYHAIRLLWDAHEICEGRGPQVEKRGGEYQILMSIRRGEVDQQYVADLGKRLLDGIEAKKPWSIPEKPNADFLVEWIYSVRMEGK